MLHEVVRPGTFSRELTMQLLLGNAVEVLLLLQADVEVQPAELDALRQTADQLVAGGSFETPLSSAAVSDESIEMVTAARSALEPTSMRALQDQLKVLSETLNEVASSKSLEGLRLAPDELIRQLRAIREALSARTAVEPDEIRGFSAHR